MTVARTVRLGEVDVPRIGLGTNRLTSTPEHAGLIRAAVDAGVGLIDTAHLYTGGQSEATIGDALARDDAGRGTERGGLRSVIVATKGGYRPGQGRPDALRAQIEQSLRSLRTPTIDLYYLHRVDPETPLEDSLGAIREYVDRGAIRDVGLSQVSVDVIARARRVLPIAAVQNQYNLRDRTFDPVVDFCAAEGIVFVPFFPLAGIHARSVERIARRRGATAAQVALAWLLRRSPAILPIPGSLSQEHVRQNVGALDLDLTDQEFEELASPA